jgi:hypothetical protein
MYDYSSLTLDLIHYLMKVWTPALREIPGIVNRLISLQEDHQVSVVVF